DPTCDQQTRQDRNRQDRLMLQQPAVKIRQLLCFDDQAGYVRPCLSLKEKHRDDHRRRDKITGGRRESPVADLVSQGRISELLKELSRERYDADDQAHGRAAYWTQREVRRKDQALDGGVEFAREVDF